MGNEDQVCEAEVNCEGDYGGDEAGPEGADKVGHVANEPHGEEGEGDAIGGGLAVVLDKLGDLAGSGRVSVWWIGNGELWQGLGV